MATDFAKVEALHDHPLAYGIPEMGDHAEFLLGAPGSPRPPLRSFDDLYGDGPDARPVLPVSDDLREDLLRCVDTVAAAGFDVVVVDQTMPEQRDLGLRTVSVIVPGLLPIDFGWTRQRACGCPGCAPPCARRACGRRTSPTPTSTRPRTRSHDRLSPPPSCRDQGARHGIRP